MDHNFLKEKSQEERIQYPTINYKSYDLSKQRDYCNACGIPIFSNGFYTQYFILCDSCVRMSHEAQVKGWSGKEGKDRKGEGDRGRGYMMEEDIMQPMRKKQYQAILNCSIRIV